MSWLLLLLFTISTLVPGTCSHGRVLQPPSRASAWRRNFKTLPDYDDNGVNCGGFGRHWTRNRGRCGVCGDPYDLQQPRPHELGGKYGKGIIVARYPEGSIISTLTELTTSHLGFWEFKICPEPTLNKQSCFDKYVLTMRNGGTKFYPKESRSYKITYRLPTGLICEHCILQWRYTAGNNWGVCGNGKSMQGCGPQETFGACSDIQIFSNKTLAKKTGAKVVSPKVTTRKIPNLATSLHKVNKSLAKIAGAARLLQRFTTKKPPNLVAPLPKSNKGLVKKPGAVVPFQKATTKKSLNTASSMRNANKGVIKKPAPSLLLKRATAKKSNNLLLHGGTKWKVSAKLSSDNSLRNSLRKTTFRRVTQKIKGRINNNRTLLQNNMSLT